MRVITIASRRHLAPVRVLATSLRETNPSVMFSVVLSDLLSDEEILGEDFEVVDPSALDLTSDDLGRMTLMYDEAEFASVLRPWALRWALRTSDERCAVYLAPDTTVHTTLDDLERTAQRHGVGLCPRRLTPIPGRPLR